MAETTLVIHEKGTQLVTRAELDAVPCPEGSRRWRPIKHGGCLNLVLEELQKTGYAVRDMRLALSREGKRFYGALMLDADVAGVADLAVGIASSIDRSTALRFGCGHRTYACSNLAYSSQKPIAKKHTKGGLEAYKCAIAQEVSSLDGYREAEAERIRRMQSRIISDHYAEAFLLRAYRDHQILSPQNRSVALNEWRTPSFPNLETKNAWRLFSACTYALLPRAETNPSAHTRSTVHLSSLLSDETDLSTTA